MLVRDEYLVGICDSYPDHSRLEYRDLKVKA